MRSMAHASIAVRGGEQHLDGSIWPLLSTGKRAALFGTQTGITERYGTETCMNLGG